MKSECFLVRDTPLSTTPRDSATLAYLGLEPETLLAAVAQLGLSPDGRLLALASYENRVYRVGLDHGGHVVAKFYRPGRWTDAEILEEHRFSEELVERDIPVVPPSRIAGTTLHHVDGFRVALFEFRPGRAPEIEYTQTLRQLGRLAARIHAVGRCAEFEHRPAIDLDSYGVDSANFLLQNEFIPDELVPAYETIAEQLLGEVDSALSHGAATLRIHADLHPGNLLHEDEALFIVDLDDARSGPAIQDLWMFLAGPPEEQRRQLEPLLEGYREFGEFDASELGMVEALRTLRMMHYSAWLARRWADPAFKRAFPWFNTQRYWQDHINDLKEQFALMLEPSHLI